MTTGVVSQIDGDVAVIEFYVSDSTILRKVFVSKGKFALEQAVTVDVSLLEKAVKIMQPKPSSVVGGAGRKPNKNSRAGVLKGHLEKISR